LSFHTLTYFINTAVIAATVVSIITVTFAATIAACIRHISFLTSKRRHFDVSTIQRRPYSSTVVTDVTATGANINSYRRQTLAAAAAGNTLNSISHM